MLLERSGDNWSEANGWKLENFYVLASARIIDRFPSGNSRQSLRGRDAEWMRTPRELIFVVYQTEGGLAISATEKWRLAWSFQLSVAA